jgi:RNA polymerase sigma-70 factor (ECF subfamily)
MDTTMTEHFLDEDVVAQVRAAQRSFSQRIEPLRPDLYRYCRRLTRDVWDAEDLVQETLTRAFAKAGDSHRRVERVLPWLLRIATNAYLDAWRRPAPIPAEIKETAGSVGADPLEVRDALSEVATLLPPQERAALVLKDVFELPLAEIAAMLATSVGAVKAALHRGRGRLKDTDGYPAARRAGPDRAVVDQLAAAFTAYDLGKLTSLLLEDAQVDVVGMVYEVGREAARTGSLHHTLVLETDVRYRADVREFDGEPIVLLWATPTDPALAGKDGAPEAVVDVLRVETADDSIARLRFYYFCPETLTEVAQRWGLPVNPTGYHL